VGFDDSLTSPGPDPAFATDSVQIVKVKAVIAVLESEGWALVRVKGSHRQFHHTSRPGIVTVAGKPSIDLPPGTLNSVLKQAGLKK